MSDQDQSVPPGESSPSEPADVAASAPQESAATSQAAEAPAQADPLAEARAEIASLKDKYLRSAADFDNFRKRARRDVEDAERRGRETLLKELLPVFDNLERAEMSAAQASDAKAVAEGVRMVLRQFIDILGRVGIKRVTTVGSPFDPNLHEAIQQLETADQPPGTVVAEVQAGYSFSDRLIRAAMVVVAKAPSGNLGGAWARSSG